MLVLAMEFSKGVSGDGLGPARRNSEGMCPRKTEQRKPDTTLAARSRSASGETCLRERPWARSRVASDQLRVAEPLWFSGHSLERR